VSDGIAHLVGKRQRQLRMRSRKLGIVFLNVIAGFADDLEVANHGVLHQLIV
jgi:hypothetical protein